MPDNAVNPSAEGSDPALRREILGFGLTGVAGFVIDAGLTVLFVQLGWMSPALARIPATAIAIGATFLLNRHWTFRSTDTNQLREFLRYLGVCLGGALINYAIYALFLLTLRLTGLADSASVAAIFAAIVAGSIAAAIFNFLGARYVAFVRRTSAPV